MTVASTEHREPRHPSGPAPAPLEAQSHAGRSGMCARPSWGAQGARWVATAGSAGSLSSPGLTFHQNMRDTATHTTQVRTPCVRDHIHRTRPGVVYAVGAQEMHANHVAPGPHLSSEGLAIPVAWWVPRVGSSAHSWGPSRAWPAAPRACVTGTTLEGEPVSPESASAGERLTFCLKINVFPFPTGSLRFG